MNSLVNGQKRERSTLWGATFASGAEQVIDFFLPLFAGSVLGLSAWQTGALVAATQLAAFIVRPAAGIAVDRFDRPMIAAGGAMIFAGGALTYAAADGFALALIASVVVGVGGAFMWVAIRAIVGERLDVDSGVFAKLAAADDTGGWIIMVPAIFLLTQVGYRWIFVGIAGVAIVAAVCMLLAKLTPVNEPERESGSMRSVAKRLRPMLIACAITATAEAAIGLLLLIQLQRGFGLELVQIALVYLPGAIALGILPPLMHRLVVRFGRRTMLMVGSTLSAAFAVGLAFAPDPVWIAVMWVMSAAAWATLIPIQQSVIAEASGRAQLGRGFSLFEAATLAGAFVGSLGAGILFDAASFFVACIVCAVIIAAGIIITPLAVRALGVKDRPDPVPRRTAETETGATTASPAPEAVAPVKKELVNLGLHTGLFAVAMLVGVFTIPDFSLAGLFSNDLPTGDGIASFLPGILRIWCVVWVIDVIWVLTKISKEQ